MLIGPSPRLEMEIYVDTSFCDGCAHCIDECSMGVFKIVGGKALVENEYICVGCFKCQNFCPMNAIQPRIVMRVS
jgi:NAD-dependent dihydropyrimidine dehydrogenase PreA subunit